MPRKDPVTPPPSQPIGPKVRRVLPWLAAFSLVVAAIAVLLVAHGDSELHIHMLIATGLGVFLTVLLGTGLMTLTFLSNSSGHDASAADHQDHHDRRP